MLFTRKDIEINMLDEDKRITTKEILKEFLNYELPKYGNLGIQKILLANEASLLRHHQILLRKAEYHTNANHRILSHLYKFRLYKFQNRYELHIPLNCCSKGLHILHLGPILINEHVTIGENCSIHMNTAIVAGGTSDDVPTLGNGIVVGIGAVVLGGITLADNIAIGANAVVNKSFFEENIAIAGVPACKVSNNGRTHWSKKADKPTINEA